MKKKEVVDSWDDEVSDDDTEANDIASDLRLPPTKSPAPPPDPPAPTPAVGMTGENSGSYYSYDPNTYSRAGGYSETGAAGGPRQAKTDAVARRMIASALGVRSRSTKEQKDYEASLKQKAAEEKAERKKAEAEAEKAKQAIWED